MLVGRGSFLHWVAVMALLAYVAVPALVVAGVAMSLCRKWKAGSITARLAGTVALVAASTIVSLWPGSILRNHDIRAAKGYCESLVPKLEAFHRAHGSYPSSVEPVADTSHLPRLLRGSQFYHSDGREYSFLFSNPARMMNFIEFSGAMKSWSEWH